MEKFVEVVAKSDLDTMLIIRREVPKDEYLEAVVSSTMYRIKKLNTSDETFKLVSVRAMNTIQERENS